MKQIIAILIIGMGFINPVMAEEKPVQAAIGDFIKLLKEKKYVKALQTYMHPDEMNDAFGGKSAEEFVEKTFKKKAPKLMEALIQAVNSQPEMKKDGTVAIFSITQGTGAAQMIFYKIEGKWYLSNKKKYKE